MNEFRQQALNNGYSVANMIYENKTKNETTQKASIFSPTVSILV